MAMIPFSMPELGQEEVEAVTALLVAGFTNTQELVAQLEERWARRIGARHAIGVSNGGVALMSIFAGLGLGPADEVITVAYAPPGTTNAILWSGATPVFVDVEPDTLLIDAKRIEAAITTRTVAIAPVHLAGLVADMDMIRAIADRYGLAVVEDASHAAGATFRGRAAGSFGHGAFAMDRSSNVSAGEGGIVTTNDDRLASWIRVYRNEGLAAGRARSDHLPSGTAELLGFDFRLAGVAAAIGLVQLAKLEVNTVRRRALAAVYDAAFEPAGLRTPITPSGRTHAFSRYVLRTGPRRQAVLADVRAAGIDARVDHPVPLHRQPYVQERGLHAKLPITDRAAVETLSLPLSPGLGRADQDRVIEGVTMAVQRNGPRRELDELTRQEAAAR